MVQHTVDEFAVGGESGVIPIIDVISADLVTSEIGVQRPRFAGFYLYYPSRRNTAPKLRALIDHVQRFR